MRTLRLCAVVPILIALVACKGQRTGTDGGVTIPSLPPGQPPTGIVVDSARVPSLSVIAGCVEDRPRMSFAEIRWTTPRTVQADTSTVDYTVYKDGFTTARYATLAVAAEPRMQLLFRPELETTALRIRGVATRRAGDTVIVRVERLDPGINYLWRLRTRLDGQWIAGAAVRIPAPTCVYDEPR